MSDSPSGSGSSNASPRFRIQLKDGSDSLCGVKQAVVVLNRLPDYQLSGLRPPTPPQFYSEGESDSSSDSEMQWKPDGDSSDSDLPTSNNKRENGKLGKACKCEATKPATSQVNKNTYDDTRDTRPDLPEQEVRVDMFVLAKKKTRRWQRGKILGLITREDGRVKYKIGFDEKGKSLVSGHHMAFDTTPLLEQLYVGARVVISSQDPNLYRPGILAELPSRKNRLRFLVFLDDHKPFYLGLPSLHLVCRPLDDSLDDLQDGPHKMFMKKYLKDWPYPHLTHYAVGDELNAELNGAQQRCDVETVDSSLIEVVFREGQQKEWLHRGSVRLEHMQRYINMKGAEEKSD
ncbi:histone-lysine N-methyltransferase SETDB1-B-like [Antennarius striatus]|uniref:histone-lysine N-methyltransferase SETDB1-B-like n=1 Tax=Antennarius striatus TaxID=241820 RepID=UPI0035B0E6BE